MKQIFFIPILFFSLFFHISCQTKLNLKNGLQNGYESLNPASIIAVPPFLIPSPIQGSAIDLASVSTNHLVEAIEDQVVKSFANQPNINGYTFSAVKKILKKQNNHVIENLTTIMEDAALRFNSKDTKNRLLIPQSCLLRRNFIEFYNYCLSSDNDWTIALNHLSSKIMNADSALFVIVTDTQNLVEDGQYKIRLGLCILLVDTNNGKLIWGQERLEHLENPITKQEFPSFSLALKNIFQPSFWNEFPGRKVDSPEVAPTGDF